MKIFNFQKIMFRINVVVITIVFVLLLPTTRIIAAWYPGQTDLLWFFPVAVLVITTLLWFMTSLSIPFLIKKGIFEERRKTPRPELRWTFRRFWRITLPVITLVIQMLLLIFLCMSLIAFMRSETLPSFLERIALKQKYR